MKQSSVALELARVKSFSHSSLYAGRQVLVFLIIFFVSEPIYIFSRAVFNQLWAFLSLMRRQHTCWRHIWEFVLRNANIYSWTIDWLMDITSKVNMRCRSLTYFFFTFIYHHYDMGADESVNAHLHLFFCTQTTGQTRSREIIKQRLRYRDHSGRKIQQRIFDPRECGNFPEETLSA